MSNWVKKRDEFKEDLGEIINAAKWIVLAVLVILGLLVALGIIE